MRWDTWLLMTFSKEKIFNRNQTNSALPHLPYAYKLKDSYELLTKIKFFFGDFFLYV